MPMDREKYEDLLSELLTPELEHSRKTEILQELRADYSGVLTDFDEFSKTTQRLQKDNEDLIISNSKLFRQAGIVGNEDKIEEIKEKEFSETITLEALEKTL